MASHVRLGQQHWAMACRMSFNQRAVYLNGRDQILSYGEKYTGLTLLLQCTCWLLSLVSPTRWTPMHSCWGTLEQVKGMAFRGKPSKKLGWFAENLSPIFLSSQHSKYANEPLPVSQRQGVYAAWWPGGTTRIGLGGGQVPTGPGFMVLTSSCVASQPFPVCFCI